MKARMEETCPSCRTLLLAYRRYVGEYAKAVQSLAESPDFGRAYERVQELRCRCRQAELEFKRCSHESAKV
ncbi:MAG TPA: hypothetical protein VG672_01730, partial [Bryobacteraceae bacterium]|nr:hypothetical protein [Bryobacteraceae bacterium]